MACDLTTIQTDACTSGIGKVQDPIQLLQLIAQLVCEAAEGGGGGGSAYVISGVGAPWRIWRHRGNLFRYGNRSSNTTGTRSLALIYEKLLSFVLVLAAVAASAATCEQVCHECDPGKCGVDQHG
jgi:hypothetical protein